MICETFPVGVLQCNCTILADEATREAVVVNPGAELAKILWVLAHHGLTVRRIVVTHAHIDHIAGAGELRAITGAPVLYNQADLPLVALMGEQAEWIGVPEPEVRPPDRSPADAEHIVVAGVDATVLFTPGHTPGSLCLHLPDEKLLLSGDTLFQGSVGRTDLPGGHHGQILGSIRERLLPLPDDTLVVPGHGTVTTIGEERRSNPFLL